MLRASPSFLHFRKAYSFEKIAVWMSMCSLHWDDFEVDLSDKLVMRERIDQASELLA